MRKQFLHTMLLALLCVVGGVTSAWADGWSIDFAAIGANYPDKTNVTISESVATIGGTDMGTCTVEEEALNGNFVLQTQTSWMIRKANGLYQGNGGARSMGMLNCTEGQIITIVGTGDPNPAYNATLKSQDGNTYVYTVNTDGNVKFTPARYLYFTSITVEDPVRITATYDFEDGTNPFTDRSRITSAIEEDVTLNSNVLGFTCPDNAQNGYSFADFDLTPVFVKAESVTFEFDYYNTKTGRALLTIGDKDVRGTTGGSSTVTYNPSGAIFRIGSDKNYAIINGTNLDIDTYCNKWLHVKVTIKPNDKKVFYVVKDGETVLKEESNIDYYNEEALKCSQIDLFGYINDSHCAMIDNLTIKYIPGNVDYSVKGIDAQSNELYTIASGNGMQNSSITVSYSTYYNNNGKLLEADKIDGNKQEYNYTFNLDGDPTEKTITYKDTEVENVVFLTEAEDIEGITQADFTNRASKGKIGYTGSAETYKDLTTLQPGKYQIYAKGLNGNSSARTANFKAGSDIVFEFSITTGTNVLGNSEEFTVNEPATLSMASEGSSASGLDWIYVVKTGNADANALKDRLSEIIAEATAFDAAELSNSISTAQAIYDNSNATPEEIQQAIDDLQQAIDEYKAANFITDGGTYYIKNVATDKWLGPGNKWGSQASVLDHADHWKLALNDGKYTLESVVSNGGTSYYLNGTYCDGGSTSFTLTKVDGKRLTFNVANDEGKLMTTDGTIVNMEGTDANAEATQWQFFSEADMLNVLNAATIESPADATYLIKDHNIGRHNRDYSSSWSNTGATAPKSSAGDGASVVYSIEAFRAVFDVNQTLTNIPNGVYALRVNGFYRQDGSAALPYIYANDEQTTLPLRTGQENTMQDAAVSLQAGNYLSDPAYVQVTNGTLKVGVATTGNSCWVIFKNFHLTYYGNHTVNEVKLATFIKEYNEAMAEAQSYQQQQMFETSKTALNEAITNNTLNVSAATEEQLSTATGNLKAAAAQAAKDVVKYETYNNIVAAVQGKENVNISQYIENLDFEKGDLTGWTSTDGGNIANNTNFNSSKFVERWRDKSANEGLSDGSLTHDEIALPKGIYTISADAQNIEQYNNNAGGKGYFLCANDAKVEIGAKGNYKFNVKFNENVNDVTLKYLLENCTGNWIACDNLTIVYVAEEFPEVTLVDGKMNADVANAQTAAKQTFDADQTIDNYNALVAAIDAADKSVKAYQTALQATTAARDLLSAHNFATADAQSTFEQAIEAIETPYENNTLTTDAGQNALISLGMAVTGWHAGANSAASNYMESTFGLNDFGSSLYINTWSEEGENDGSDFKVPFYEYFAGDGNKLPANTWTAQLTGVENGLYKVKAWVRLRTQNDQVAVADLTGITMQVNEGDAIDVTEGTQIGDSRFQLAEYEAKGLVKDNTLKLNFIIDAENNIHWLSFKNIYYEKVRDLKPEEEAIAPDNIYLSDDYLELRPYEQAEFALELTFDPEDAEKGVIWTSSDETVATVDQNGLVSAHTPGFATITVTSTLNPDVTATASVVVSVDTELEFTSAPAEGDFFIRNVATGYYLGGANDYGTHASVIKHAIPFGLTEKSEGVYTLDSYTYNGGDNHFFTGTYVDGAATDVTIVDLAEFGLSGLYALEVDGKLVTVQPGQTIVANTFDDPEASIPELAMWQFVSREDMLKNMNSENDAAKQSVGVILDDIDATFLLSEANISRNLRKSSGNSSWRGNTYEYWDNGQKKSTNDGFVYGGNQNNQCGENYHSATNVYQTISVPNGTYKVRVQGFYRADNGSQDASYLYANDQRVVLPAFNANNEGTDANMNGASTAFSAGQYWSEWAQTEVTDNKLTVAIKTDDTNNWTIWDNFEVYMVAGTGQFANVETDNGMVVVNGIANYAYYLTPIEKADEQYIAGKQYIYRGGDSETQATLATDNQLLYVVNTDIAGITTMSFWDYENSKDSKQRLFWNEEMVYTNGTQHVQKNYHHPYWAIELVDPDEENDPYFAGVNPNPVITEANGNIYKAKLRNIETGLYLAMGNGVVTANTEGSVWYLDRLDTPELLNKLVEGWDDYVLGFDEGDYTPYLNKEGMKLMAEVDAINEQFVANDNDIPYMKVQNLYNKIDNSTFSWTVNGKEMNAFYDYTFANAEPDGAPLGWTMSNNTLGGAYHARAFVGDDRLAEFNDTKSGFFMRFDGTNSDRGSMYYYGNTEGYTMPLKADTYYRITVDAANWGTATNKPLRLNVTGPEGFTAVSQQLNMKYDADKTDNAPQQFNIMFKTADAGNYVVNFQVPGGGNEHNVVISNLRLFRALEDLVIDEDADFVPAERYANVTLKRTLVEGWNGLMLPFDMSVDDLKTYLPISDVKDFESITFNDQTQLVTLNFADASEIKAGVPFLVKADEAGSQFNFGTMLLGNHEVQTVNKKAEGNENIQYTMTSSYAASTDLTNVTFALINGNKFFYHMAESSSSKAKGMRAWFVNESTDPAAGARLSFNLGDESTGISQVGVSATEGSQLYDLQGRAVNGNAVRKGLYIRGGKKQIVK